ncbi:hypothetical protein ABIA30_001225 [Mycobacterium sp. MAA66]
MTQRGDDVVLLGFFDTPLKLSLNAAVLTGITIGCRWRCYPPPLDLH